MPREAGLKVYALSVDDAVVAAIALGAETDRINADAIMRHVVALSVDAPLIARANRVGCTHSCVVEVVSGLTGIAVASNQVEGLAVDRYVCALAEAHRLPLAASCQWGDHLYALAALDHVARIFAGDAVACGHVVLVTECRHILAERAPSGRNLPIRALHSVALALRKGVASDAIQAPPSSLIEAETFCRNGEALQADGILRG